MGEVIEIVEEAALECDIIRSLSYIISRMCRRVWIVIYALIFIKHLNRKKKLKIHDDPHNIRRSKCAVT